MLELHSVCLYMQIDADEGQSVFVVGDTHGQAHDVWQMLRERDAYSGKNIFVFNGTHVSCLMLHVCLKRRTSPSYGACTCLYTTSNMRCTHISFG